MRAGKSESPEEFFFLHPGTCPSKNTPHHEPVRPGCSRGPHKQLFHPDSVLAYKQDCKSNYYEARRTGQEYRICDQTMDAIRQRVDQCDNLQGSARSGKSLT